MTEKKKSTDVEHLKGSVKEALGKLTGDARIESEGERQKRQARTSGTDEKKGSDRVRD